MPTRSFMAVCAALIAAQVLALAALPFELAEPGDTLVHGLAYGGLTLLLWIATDGRRAQLVPASVMLLALLAELAQAFAPARGAQPLDFLAAAAAVSATAALLYRKQQHRKQGARPCAESSGR